MNLLDVCIIGLLAVSMWFGLHRPFLRQTLITIATVVSLGAVTVAYSKLAFLTAQSGARALVLVLLVFAVGFLLYDMLLSLAAHFGLKKHRLRHLSWQGVCSALLAAATLLVAVWPASAIVSTSQVPLVSQQTQGSFILASLNHAGTVPGIFTQIAHVIEPFSAPQVFAGSEPTFQSTNAIASDQFGELDVATSKARSSILKVQSWGCGSTSIGSGILVRDSIIVTNAHVVMGATRVSVQNPEGTYAATVIRFDPEEDVAVLRTSKTFAATPLNLVDSRLTPGSVGATLGYPGGGSLTISDAVVLKVLTAEGLDIYGRQKTTRTIYAVRGSVEPGSSGGALMAANGSIVGLVFGHSTVQNRTGYALTTDQVIPEVDAALQQNQAASTGACSGA